VLLSEIVNIFTIDVNTNMYYNLSEKTLVVWKGRDHMGIFHKLCFFCQVKRGLSSSFYCALTGLDLDQKSDLFRFGCDGGSTGYKWCPFYKEDK